MSGLKRKIYKGLPERGQDAKRCKGALCQKSVIHTPCGKELNSSASLLDWLIGRSTSTKSSSLGLDWNKLGAITQTKPTTTKHVKKNSVFTRPQEWLLKGQNKMTDKEELIKALAIAIACLKSKTFDDGIIGDLEATLKKNMGKEDEKSQN